MSHAFLSLSPTIAHHLPAIGSLTASYHLQIHAGRRLPHIHPAFKPYIQARTRHSLVVNMIVLLADYAIWWLCQPMASSLVLQ
jgi:hypothetical protein